MNLGIKVRTAIALGTANLARVLVYRLALKTRSSRHNHQGPSTAQGPFFRAANNDSARGELVDNWGRTALLFGHLPTDVGQDPPDWLRNPLNGKRFPQPLMPWWKIPDFNPEMGDIKGLWELSRMGWLIPFAQRARHGDGAALETLNAWLTDWLRQNPPYYGPNWKCGQEAAIRVMHLAACAIVLDSTPTGEPPLRELLHRHLNRIAETLHYAIAQDNNHGTSEAAALFIGGSWLNSIGDPAGARWARIGRQRLEERVVRLVGESGSFSQYSANYHRLFLDTCCLAEVWRRRMRLPEFSDRFLSRLRVAGEWLRQMVDPTTGDAPNVGTNDGAHLLPLTDAAYRDFRPTCQLAAALFSGQAAYGPDGAWNWQLRWLGIPIPSNPASPPATYVADDGGFAMLHVDDAMAMLRYPRFRFRPGQADALHLDLWVNHKNVLRDAGTYSYNTDSVWMDYFAGVTGHNTIQFDSDDQMPRLGRFLFGDWLQTDWINPLHESLGRVSFGAGYTDRTGRRHRRTVTLAHTRLLVRDEVAGFQRSATLRWRLIPGTWRLSRERDCCVSAFDEDRHFHLSIQSTVPITCSHFVDGWESRHYMERTPLTVLEVEIQNHGILETQVSWEAE